MNINIDEIVNKIIKLSSKLKIEIFKDDYGEYVYYSNIDLDQYSQEIKVKIIKNYLLKKFEGKELILDKDRVLINKHGIKKMSKYSKNNVDKAYVELEKIAAISKFICESENTKSLKNNAPFFKYYETRLKIGLDIFTFKMVVKIPVDGSQKAYLYSIQNKNTEVVSSDTARYFVTK